MRMIEVLKNVLQEGMEISNIKEYAAKTKFTLTYKGMCRDKCEIQNTCLPGCEEEVCRQVINTIISSMYINTNNPTEAKLWLDGCQWEEKKEV